MILTILRRSVEPVAGLISAAYTYATRTETSQQWQPQAYRADSDVFNHYANWPTVDA